MTALVPGLVSISFRGLAVDAVIDLAVRCGLRTIEWGGDVHVPHGDVRWARNVGRRTRDAGLSIASYGSYYRFDDVVAGDGTAGETRDVDSPAVDGVLDTAAALGTPIVRVWAGRLGSAECSAAHRGRIVEEARRIGDRAAERGLTVVFEYHGDTLTDTPVSAESLLREIAHPRVRSFWQPSHRRNREENRGALDGIHPWLRGVHLFYWGRAGSTDRLPLGAGAADIGAWLSVLRSSPSGGRLPVMLEYVRGDDPEQLRADAATLLRLIAETHPVSR